MNIPAAYGRISPIAAQVLFIYYLIIEAVHLQTPSTGISLCFIFALISVQYVL